MKISEKSRGIMLNKGGVILELLQFVLIVLIIIIPIRMFVAQPFVVVGQSMEPTFISNEYLIVDELTYRLDDPKRGQVIVFKYPYGEVEGSDSKYFIKRIIGLPGETVVIKKGVVSIQNKVNPKGFVLDEPYIKARTDTSLTMTLGKDQYFVMGDNRAQSFDSRAWGPLSSEFIVGKAFIRLLPPTKAGFLPGSYTNTNQ
jgi:signal peptidase I